MQGFDIATKYQNPVFIFRAFVQIHGTKWSQTDLVRKGDTYYFRHCVPAAVQHLGKREFIKTLKVSRKSEAVQISRELKIIFDLIMKKSEKNPSIPWNCFKDGVQKIEQEAGWLIGRPESNHPTLSSCPFSGIEPEEGDRIYG